jgi:hypothetical protein
VRQPTQRPVDVSQVAPLGWATQSAFDAQAASDEKLSPENGVPPPLDEPPSVSPLAPLPLLETRSSQVSLSTPG